MTRVPSREPSEGSAVLAAETRSAARARFTRLGEWLANSVAAYQTRWLLCVVAIFAALSLLNAILKPLWFDELFAVIICNLPTFDLVKKALPADGHPPLLYILEGLSMKVFGANGFGARLPELLGFIGAFFATYRFVRRRAPAVFAIFAVAFFAGSSASTYSYEGRPYGLMLGFTALALVCWQAASERNHARLLPLVGVAVGIAGAICSHHYGVIEIGVPLIFGEAVRLMERRRPDLPMYAAAAAGLCMLIVTYPFSQASRAFMFDYVQKSNVFWAKPELKNLLSYHYTIPLILPVALLVWFAVVGWKRNSEDVLSKQSPATHPFTSSSRLTAPRYEIAASIGLALLIPVLLIVTKIATGYFRFRYCIASAMGVAILAGLLAPLLPQAKRTAGAMIAVCLASMLWIQIYDLTITNRESRDEIAPLLALPGGKQPIVVANCLIFLKAWWYAPPQLRQRLTYLVDVPYAVQQPDFLPELSLAGNEKYFPVVLHPYQEFLAGHSDFLLYVSDAPNLEWTRGRLIRDGRTFHLKNKVGKFELYEVL